jgi:uncharacterized protein DUF2188
MKDDSRGGTPTRPAVIFNKGVQKMANKKDYHVVPRGEDWAVKREGSKRAASVHPTQSEAEKAGRDLAKTNKVEVVIHRPNGQIRDSDSFGNDPSSIKDKKH